MLTFPNKPSPLSLRSIEIGNGNLILEVPRQYQPVTEEDGRILVVNPEFTQAALRLSVMNVSDERQPKATQLGVKNVQSIGQKRHLKVQRAGDKAYFMEVLPSEHNGKPLEVRMWVIGFGNYIVYLSCTFILAVRDDPHTQVMLAAVEPAIHSLRESRFQSYKLAEPVHATVTELTPDHFERLQRGREAVSTAVKAIGQRLLGTEKDLRALQQVLDRRDLDKGNTVLLEGLGVVLGDFLTKKVNAHWMTVTDEGGSLPALRHTTRDVTFYATDAIIKRVVRGDKVDVLDLYHSFATYFRKVETDNKPPTLS